MISRTWSRKSIAFCLAIAVLSIYSMVALAAPGQQGPAGELSVSGKVTVNGQNAISGATVFSDSTIVTSQNSSAVVSLGKLGRVELLPGTSLKISFSENSISGVLDSGRLQVSVPQGIATSFTTKDAMVVSDMTQATNVFTIDLECGNTITATQTGKTELRAGDRRQPVAAGQDASAGTAQPGTRCTRLKTEGMKGLSGGALAALLLAAGGAVAAAIIAGLSENNDINFGGNVTVVSPTK
jgi:hypothetical protein